MNHNILNRKTSNFGQNTQNLSKSSQNAVDFQIPDGLRHHDQNISIKGSSDTRKTHSSGQPSKTDVLLSRQEMKSTHDDDEKVDSELIDVDKYEFDVDMVKITGNDTDRQTERKTEEITKKEVSKVNKNLKYHILDQNSNSKRKTGNLSIDRLEVEPYKKTKLDDDESSENGKLVIDTDSESELMEEKVNEDPESRNTNFDIAKLSKDKFLQDIENFEVKKPLFLNELGKKSGFRPEDIFA